MSYKPQHPPFWKTRKALSRLPLATQLCAAAMCGALTMFVLQSSVSRKLLHQQNQSRSIASSTSDVVEYNLKDKPKPIVVVAAGLPRTGSTWVYNVLRILMRIRDPNSVAGWYADLIAIWKNHKTHRYDNMKVSWLEAYRSLNTSLLLKMHGPGPFKLFSHGKPLSHSADLTVITHRDLRTEVRSWVYQNWNSSIHAGDIENTPFGDATQWVRVAHHILNERKTTINSIGDGRFLDIRYEEWNQHDLDAQIRVVATLANQLDWDFTDSDLRAAAIEAARLEAPAAGAVLMYNPVNKLHPGHTRIDSDHPSFKIALEKGYNAITEDPDCNAFLRSKHYI